MQGRELVTEGFTPARGHQHKGITAIHGLFDDVLLEWSEFLQAKDLAECFVYGIHGLIENLK